jgi:hypothetical protein
MTERVNGFSLSRSVTNFTPYHVACAGLALETAMENHPDWDIYIPDHFFTPVDLLSAKVLSRSEFERLAGAKDLRPSFEERDEAKLYIAGELGSVAINRTPKIDTLPARHVPAREKKGLAITYLATTDALWHEQLLVRDALLKYFKVKHVPEGVWAFREHTGVKFASTNIAGASTRLTKLMARVLNQNPNVIPKTTDLAGMTFWDFSKKIK